MGSVCRPQRKCRGEPVHHVSCGFHRRRTTHVRKESATCRRYAIMCASARAGREDELMAAQKGSHCTCAYNAATLVHSDSLHNKLYK